MNKKHQYFHMINTRQHGIKHNQFYAWDYNESIEKEIQLTLKDSSITADAHGDIHTIYHTGTIDNFIEVAACNTYYTLLCDYKNKLWCYISRGEIKMHSFNYKSVLYTYVLEAGLKSFELYYNDVQIKNSKQYNVQRKELDNLLLKAKKIKHFLNNTYDHYKHPEASILFYINEVL